MYERLAALRQIGSVEDYVQEFELLVAQALSTPEEQLLGYFLTGLHQDIGAYVPPHDPKDLTQAMEVARDIEEAMKEVRSDGGSQVRNTGTGFRYQGGARIVLHKLKHMAARIVPMCPMGQGVICRLGVSHFNGFSDETQ